MVPDLEARIEAGRVAYEDHDTSLDMSYREVAETVVRAAFPELFTDPPQAWIAPMELDWGDFATKEIWEDIRNAHLAKQKEPSD